MNLIFQYYIGDIVPDYAKMSRFSFLEYADKYGHEYLFSTEQYLPEHWASGYFDVIQVYMDPFFDQYDYVLFCDADVLAHPRSPDVFKYKPKHIAGWTEQHHPLGRTSPGYEKGSEKYKLIESAFKEFDAPLIESSSPFAATRILNSGVLLFSKEARLIAREKFDDWQKWSDMKYDPWLTLDQFYLSAMFNKYNLDVLELENEWNITPDWFNASKLPDSYFYHCSGSKGKDTISEYFSEFFKEFNL